MFMFMLMLMFFFEFTMGDHEYVLWLVICSQIKYVLLSKVQKIDTVMCLECMLNTYFCFSLRLDFFRSKKVLEYDARTRLSLDAIGSYNPLSLSSPVKNS